MSIVTYLTNCVEIKRYLNAALY
nr:unnamed protein product [Callosobruchus chinensis]